MQRLLTQMGFDAGPADGIPGRATSRAIMAFQRQFGFPATGTLTPAEIQALERAAAPAVAPRSLTASVDVREVQAALTDRGFGLGRIDGLWGAKSQQALDTFRAQSDIDRRGPPTPDDLAMLRRSSTLPSPQAASAAPDLDLETVGDAGEVLISLPVVDRGRPFRVAWSGKETGDGWLAILPRGAAPEPGIPAWPLGASPPTALTAPEAPGQYEIVWISVRDGSVSIRRPLEVR